MQSSNGTTACEKTIFTESESLNNISAERNFLYYYFSSFILDFRMGNVKPHKEKASNGNRNFWAKTLFLLSLIKAKENSNKGKTKEIYKLYMKRHYFIIQILNYSSVFIQQDL